MDLKDSTGTRIHIRGSCGMPKSIQSQPVFFFRKIFPKKINKRFFLGKRREAPRFFLGFFTFFFEKKKFGRKLFFLKNQVFFEKKRFFWFFLGKFKFGKKRFFFGKSPKPKKTLLMSTSKVETWKDELQTPTLTAPPSRYVFSNGSPICIRKKNSYRAAGVFPNCCRNHR